MSRCSKRRAGLLLFVAIAAVGALCAQDIPTIPLDAAYVVTPEGKVATDRAAIHPGSTVGLALDLPRPSSNDEQDRSALAGLRFVVPDHEDDPEAGDDFRIVRFLPGTPPEHDILEVLLISLGAVEIPALEVRDESGSVLARTSPLSIDVVPSLGEDDVEAAPPRGVHALSLDIAGLWILLAAVVALLALLVTAIVFYRRWKKPRQAQPPPPAVQEAADLRALRLLRELLDSGLLERREIKLFCIRLADIGKEYVGRISNTHLEEMTTTECIRALSRSGFDPARCRWLESWLHSIDMVKFAKHRPERSELTELAADLRTLIEETKAASPVAPNTVPSTSEA